MAFALPEALMKDEVLLVEVEDLLSEQRAGDAPPVVCVWGSIPRSSRAPPA